MEPGPRSQDTPWGICYPGRVTDISDPDRLPSTPEDDETDGPDVAAQVFGFLVAAALVVIAATFVIDSFRGIF